MELSLVDAALVIVEGMEVVIDEDNWLVEAICDIVVDDNTSEIQVIIVDVELDVDIEEIDRRRCL